MRKFISLNTFLQFLLVVSLGLILILVIRGTTLGPEERLSLGINAYANEEYDKAKHCFKDVVISGQKDLVAIASFYLGNLYLKEKGGARQAEMYFEQASVLGHAEAAYKLALLYDAGTKLPENREKAIALMTRAAKKQLPEAFYVLGVWGERGYMGKVSPDKIVALYEQAAQKGFLPAMTSLVALYAPGEVTASPKRFAYWKKKLLEQKLLTQ